MRESTIIGAKEIRVCVDWLANSRNTVDHLNLIVLETPSGKQQQSLFDNTSIACMPRNMKLIL
jgi:hypothetical protein